MAALWRVTAAMAADTAGVMAADIAVVITAVTGAATTVGATGTATAGAAVGAVATTGGRGVGDGAASGLGLYFASLPYYYSTYWYGGVPYYYAGNTYYVYDGTVGQYRTVAPPVGPPEQEGAGAQVPSELISYPKNGQSADQQATDKYECYKWAVSQLGYDPTTAGGGTVRRDLTDYNRAQTACLEARGYSVK